ncbi:hypothetical protein [Stutzerimonas stutzeri]|uniref:hypothetical protein n=1 Tax=Stutzerimonas stutzeri TaxID=316 RepID=UPI000AFD3595|nr:hypothetical protein [Stutzerimonas stutzeri]
MITPPPLQLPVLPPAVAVPFVFIVDSPSAEDLYGGYTIGMALRDALIAVKIPCEYKLTTDAQRFYTALNQGLHEAVVKRQTWPQTNAYPLLHLCMHGNTSGVAFTDGNLIGWSQLRQLLSAHDAIKGHPPFVCMASCNGFDAVHMASASDTPFSFLVGNTQIVGQSDLTVGYLAFYHQLVYRNANVEQAVIAMRAASGNHNFVYQTGEQVRNYKIQEMLNSWSIPSGAI